jgi:DNA repair exonuclease SbcCD ATPase subunit
MTITPLALRLTRFGSFIKTQTFEFPQQPGLYLMLGKNEVEPRLGGNAAGKSTIWKALTWLVHGKTPDGMKAGDVCNWDETEGTRVEFDFICDGVQECIYTCTRTWKPNTWTLSHVADFITDEETIDLAKDPQNPLLASLRMSFDTWLCTVLMAQGEDYFLDMKRDAQAALFGSVMDLDEWEQRSDRASKAASEEDKRLRKLEGDESYLRGKLEAAKNDAAADLAEEWEENRLKKLDRVKLDHDDACRLRKRLKEALDAAVERAEEQRKALAAAKRNEALEAEYDLVCANVRAKEDALLKLQVETNALREHLKHLEKDTACPLCKRPYETKDWQQEVKRAERVLSGADSEADNIKHVLKIARSRRDVLEVEIDKQEDAERGYSTSLRMAEADVAHARNELLSCDKELDKLEEFFELAEKERNPYTDAAERARRDVEELEDRMHSTVRQLRDSESQFAIKQMWVRGFKEIRLREIASALSELEMEVNSAVMALGLSDWELRFDVDRETKSKTVQRGFSVSVLSPTSGNKVVPWEAWSGGEKQRLRIAGNAGLSDLVRTRTGCAFPLEVWDEPTNGLSPEGKTDLFEYLAERAKSEGRIIMLLDHQAHDFGGFAGTCTIIKTPSGSRIRTSW